MSETKRNEAIDRLENLLERTDFEILLIDEKNCDELHKNHLRALKSEKTTFARAISALHTPFDAAWKIARIKQRCFDELEEENNRRYSCRESRLADDIFEILDE